MNTSVLLSALLALQTVASTQAPGTTLDALRDHRRVLLVFANGDNELAAAQLAVAAKHASEFRERDLVLAGVQGTDAAVPMAELSVAADASARARFHVAAGQFTVLLIGKDGGEKMRSHKPIPWDTLQTTIDAMPMRRQESGMRGQFRGLGGTNSPAAT